MDRLGFAKFAYFHTGRETSMLNKLLVAVLSLAGLVVPGSAQARFVSVDPVPADQTDGSNHNRYAYTNNNPYGFVDPDGRLPIAIPIVMGIGWMLKAGSANAPAPGQQTHAMSPVEAMGEFAGALPAGRMAMPVRIGIDAASGRPEPSQLSRGKRAHREEPVLPGERAEVATPSGKRMDRYNEEAGHIREIKPDNPRAIRQGENRWPGTSRKWKQPPDVRTLRKSRPTTPRSTNHDQSARDSPDENLCPPGSRELRGRR